MLKKVPVGEKNARDKRKDELPAMSGDKCADIGEKRADARTHSESLGSK